jgi:SAM-dependent methyltransferase
VSPRHDTERYVPAAGRRVFSGVYDPVVALTMRERAFRGAVLVAALAPPVPSTVVDIGCGTGSLAIALARHVPQLRVVGVDGDPDMLARAQTKLAQSGAMVDWVEGRAERLPCKDARTDVAVLRSCCTISRRLARTPRSRRLVACCVPVGDWSSPTGAGRAIRSRLWASLRCSFDGFATTGEHRGGRLAQRIEQAGFDNLRVLQRWRTVWGSLELIVATQRPVD